MWVLRLSLNYGCTPSELEHRLTADELAEYQALVELDGPWWGEQTAAYLRQLCAVQAAAAGADLTADQFQIEWSLGGSEPVNLLPPADGLAMFAACFGTEVVEELPTAEEIP